MKNENVQHKVEYCQKNEKIEDLCPRVGMSIRELNPAFCLVFYPGTWGFWKIVLNTRLRVSYFCSWCLNQSDSGDSGSRNIVSIIVPQCASSDSLNLSCDDLGELCSERWVADWILGGNNTGRGCCSSTSTSSTTSPSSCRLGSMVARNLHPLEGTLQYINVDFDLGQSSGADGI